MVTLTDFKEKGTKILSNPSKYIEEWRQENPGKGVIGLFPTYVPRELITAAGALPVGVWGGSVSVSQANAYIQQITCSIVRTSTELALGGTFNNLDGMLFPPTCDSVKLVSSIWGYNFKDRFPVEMVNFPERLDSVGAPGYIAAELRRIRDCLSEWLKTEITDKSITEEIKRWNRQRKLIEELYDIRRKTNSISWQDMYTILKVGTFLSPQDYAQWLQGVIEELKHNAAASGQNEQVPIVVTGLSCELPHPSIFAKIESLGAFVADDDLMVGLRGMPEISTEGDPFRNLAEGYIRSTPMSTRHHKDKKRDEYIIEQVENSNAKGVILMIPKFCEPEWFDLRYLKTKLKDAGIPNLFIDFEEEAGSAEGIETRVQAFVEMLS